MLSLTRYARWPFVISLGFVVGCLDLTERPDPTDLQSLIDSHCAQVDACSCDAGNLPSTCTDELTHRWNDRVREGEERALTFDDECFAALSEEVDTSGCGWVNGATQVCTRFCAVYHGTRREGEVCEGFDSIVSNCAQGLVCSDGECTQPCAALGGRTEGEPCSNEDFGRYDDCAEGLGCDYSSGLCQILASEGDSCLGGVDCGPDLYCDPEIDRCVAAPGVGLPCDFGICADGLDCRWQADDRRYCQATALEGESCGDRRCADELLCNQANVCQSPPVAGQPCVYGNCETGAACDFESNLCRALPVEGERCLFNECDFGLWCQTSSDDPEGSCRAPIVTGEMCSGHSQCESGFCPNGFCWPRGLEGESCSGGAACGVGLVCNGSICESTPSRAPAVCTYAGW